MVSRPDLPIGVGVPSTATLRTEILEFRGFDSSRILIFRGGIIMPTGSFSERLSQRILVGIILIGRLGAPQVRGCSGERNPCSPFGDPVVFLRRGRCAFPQCKCR